MTIHSEMSRWLADITTVKQVEHFVSLLWRGHAEQRIRRRSGAGARRGRTHGPVEAIGGAGATAAPCRTYFPQRPQSERSREQAASGPRCPARWARKRRLGDMAALPPHVRDSFTEGERAALYIIAADCRQHGSCQCSIKEIGDRAGVGITTVRNALRRARLLRLIGTTECPQWRAKHLTNVVKIVCPRWTSWLQKFRPNLGLKFYPIGFNKPKFSGTGGNKRTSGQPTYNRSDGLMGGFQPFARCKPSPVDG